MSISKRKRKNFGLEMHFSNFFFTTIKYRFYVVFLLFFFFFSTRVFWCMLNPLFVVIFFQYNTIFVIVMYFNLVVFTNMCLTVWMRAPQWRPWYISCAFQIYTVEIYVQTNCTPHISKVLAFFYSFYNSVLRRCIFSPGLCMGMGLLSFDRLFAGGNVWDNLFD